MGHVMFSLLWSSLFKKKLIFVLYRLRFVPYSLASQSSAVTCKPLWAVPFKGCWKLILLSLSTQLFQSQLYRYKRRLFPPRADYALPQSGNHIIPSLLDLRHVLLEWLFSPSDFQNLSTNMAAILSPGKRTNLFYLCSLIEKNQALFYSSLLV